MIPTPRLGELVGCEALQAYTDSETWHTKRDEIKAIVAEHLSTQTTAHWLSILEPADVWCADVYTWDKLMGTEAFESLHMTQEVSRANGTRVATTCCPIVIDGERPHGGAAAPTVGQDNALLEA